MRLLLVEDDEKLARAVTRGLRGEGYAVDVAIDGDAALAQAAVYDYDAVVLDVMLPRRDGFEVCRALRQRGCWAPVLMLTARGGVHDRIDGLDAGADDYLSKPFDFGELLARLRALLRRTPIDRPAVLTVGDVVLDPATRCVSYTGRPLELTAREFAVLEYLVRRAGDVVTRTELLDHVWDENFAGSTNVVDVYVGYLRKKLGGDGSAAPIRTVRGVGFVLEA
ncbi:MAG: two-component system, OmpR family, response regulator [Thermoleophilaceae bacterium]|jgi:two-component system OmpR family response regulator|nr:two-component system, OmpR family, response regulator [Thermoleophilaceae bacterium]